MSSIVVGAKLINAKVIETKLAQAFEEWAREDINDAYWDQEFGDKKWSYSNTTYRKNTEIVTEPRDIYDLGKLYESGRESFSITQGDLDVTASWNWDAKNSSGGGYAWYVHEGLSTNVEPRRWTDELQEPARFDASELKKALKSRIKVAFE